ncbi:trypsin-like peptidase domain-containing protein [Streptomyces sp. NPDC001920]
MKQPSRPLASRLCRYAACLLLVCTPASAAAGDTGGGPFGVSTLTVATARSARVGALFAGGRRDRLLGGHFCTASVVHSPHHSLVVTAAHCLDGRTGALVFVPGYRGGRAPYGVWSVRRWFLPRRWTEGRDEDSDVAFAVLGERDGKGVEDVVGGNRFVTGAATGAEAVTVTGYPDAREAPVSCADRPSPRGRTQQRLACPGFSGGTSGSPWVDGGGRVVGVLGGHQGGGSTADVSYSVVLGAEAAALYRRAVRDP